MCRYPTSRALVTAGIDSSFETRQTPNPSWGIWTPLLSVVIGLSATDRSFVRGQYPIDTTSPVGRTRESRRSRRSHLAVLDAAGDPAARQHLDLHPSAAGGAVSRRLQRAPLAASVVVARCQGFAAAVAEGRGLGHRVFDSSLIGIWSSSSRSRSSLGSRPRVVR